jgi:hypothetical protein
MTVKRFLRILMAGGTLLCIAQTKALAQQLDPVNPQQPPPNTSQMPPRLRAPPPFMPSRPQGVSPVPGGSQETEQVTFMFGQFLDQLGEGVNRNLAAQLCTLVLSDGEEVEDKLGVMRQMILDRYQIGRYGKPQKLRVATLESSLWQTAQINRLRGLAKEAAVILGAAVISSVVSGFGVTPARVRTLVTAAQETSSARFNEVSGVAANVTSWVVDRFTETTPVQRVLKDLRRLEVAPNSLAKLRNHLHLATPEEILEYRSTIPSNRFYRTNVSRLRVAPIRLRNANAIEYGTFVFWRRFGRRIPWGKNRWLMLVADDMPEEEAEEIMTHMYRGKDKRRYPRIGTRRPTGGPVVVYAPQAPLQRLQLQYREPAFNRERAIRGFVGGAVAASLADAMFVRHEKIPNTFLESMLPPEEKVSAPTPTPPAPTPPPAASTPPSGSEAVPQPMAPPPIYQ